MSDPQTLFKEGDLDGAIQAQTAAVRSAPADVAKRWFLTELLCFSGDLDRADRSLDVIAAQDGPHQLNALGFRMLLRAEAIRRQVLFEGRAPGLLGPNAGRLLQPVVEALMLLRLGEGVEAAARLEAQAAATASLSGTRNGAAFQDFRDLDDVLAPLLELHDATGGYHWVAVGDIARLELLPLVRARDVIWRPARIEVRDGPEGEVWLPCLYAVSDPPADDELRLARRTDWVGGDDGPIRGVGLRCFLVGEDDVPVHELGAIAFAPPS